MAAHYHELNLVMPADAVEENVEAFNAALEAHSDPAVAAGIDYLITKLAMRLMASRVVKGEKYAFAQATVVIAQLISKGKFDSLIIQKLKG